MLCVNCQKTGVVLDLAYVSTAAAALGWIGCELCVCEWSSVGVQKGEDSGEMGCSVVDNKIRLG